jgi:hypothetical protein
MRRVQLSLLALLAGAAAMLSACGDTLQDHPISHTTLESLIVAPYPVYWLGGAFRGMQITQATHDPSGAFTVQYGDCVVGGQSACVTPVRIVTSPDNGFIAGGAAPQRRAPLRGVQATISQGGHTVALATGGVIVSVYAENARLAAAAAQTAVPINDVGEPGAALPAALPQTSFRRCPRRRVPCASEVALRQGGMGARRWSSASARRCDPDRRRSAHPRPT